MEDSNETIGGYQSRRSDQLPAAPTTGRVLAEWGADVVKVESFGGDPARRQAGVFNMPMADDENLAFDYANFGKSS